ncbi:hypothetical protein SAY86_003197 [Trapa natans]|uniref:Uncharacterized protein n=1 Tax=Trapa natans TaxID=22666 RepID=A0AAN7LEG6_TRANT|nr:hypothetical protein SAY86_003197 [Trapa natans]
MQDNSYDRLAVAASSHSQSKDISPEIHEWNAKITIGAYGNNDMKFNHELDLSLRRSKNGSAFSQYLNKLVNRVALGSTNLPIVEGGGEFEKNLNGEVPCVDKACNLENRKPAQGSLDMMISLVDTRFGQSKCIPSHPHWRVVHAPILFRGVGFENVRIECINLNQEPYCTEFGPSLGPSPSSVVQNKPFILVDSFQQGNISLATNRSVTTGSLCNGGTLTHHHSTNYGSISGSNGDVNHVAITRHTEGKSLQNISQYDVRICRYRRTFGICISYSAPTRSGCLKVVENNYCASKRGGVCCLSTLNIVFAIIFGLLALFLGSSLLTLGSSCSLLLFWCYELSSWGLVILYGGTAFFLRRKAATILDEVGSGSRNLGLEMLESNPLDATPEVEM